MKWSILLIFLLLFCASCERPNKNNVSSEILDGQSLPIIKSFFESVQSGQYKVALENLLKTNENIDLKDSLTLILKRRFEDINESSGKFISDRLIREKCLGDDVGIYAYIVKYENKFFRFLFIFYNNGERVKIYKFSFDDTMDPELEESIKLYSN